MKFNKNLENLTNYEAGKPIELVVREYGIKPQDVIKLASNENPFGTSPLVAKRITELATNAHLYPDDSYFELKDALANKFNVSSKNIIIGAGSDQILEYCLHAKANENSAVLMAGVTFAMYEIYAKQVGANVIKTNSQTHDLAEFRKIYDTHKDRISVIFLCVPNNPLGECLDASEVYEFIRYVKDETLVVIDAAYNEFAKFKDAKKGIEPEFIVQNFKNAIYTGTFSKAYGLGGMRVGYGIASQEIINELGKLRAPFNITTLSLAAAITALSDNEFVQNGIKSNFEQMVRYEEFAKFHGLEYIKSYTNFIILKFNEQNASQIVQNLLKKGIILRDMKSYGLNAIRITIGTAVQNDRVLAELDEILK
ncbi:histidinol-phosphate transaminase [Campylobacter suis]|uniref:Histidinol-phosphate aminotransferase n=1 Tax=Campylobacter suis TaxID=2790657 RepID=A0ABM8Q0A8_9BACT|nr:histidinol-phosphate transaminase [Campylobacter suis]CAD7286226.1 Histidinol-phosphate aminotransferase [Campylobacter suis]